MRKNWLFLATALFSLSACYTPGNSPDSHIEPVARTPQQIPFIGEEIDPDHEQLFQSAVDSARATSEGESSDVLQDLVEKQSHVFYLTSSQVEQYDQELDRLYQMKMANPKKDVDLSTLNQMKARMAISWEFTERNFHKLEYVYGRMLKEANSKNSPFKKSSSEALSKLDRLFKEKWQSSHQMAVQSIVEGLEPINKSFEYRRSGTKFPEFRKLFNTPVNQNKKSIAPPKDKVLEAEFNKFRIEREAEKLRFLNERTPQSVAGKADIKPHPGRSGDVQGREFPRGTWAITLDDGPHETLTVAMMNELEKAGLKGHFFWLSRNMQRLPHLVQEARQRGFKLALHSHSHQQLTKLDTVGLTREIDNAANLFESIVGQRPTFFRCPYGACGNYDISPVRKRIASQEMIHAFWTVDTLDWHSGSTSLEVFERTRKGMELSGGGIILFHDIQSRTVGALTILGEYMKSRPEWKTHTLDELVSMATGQPYESP
jgi:peptidoglycan/xylan/chitin deacetylase (PgdA/CDA1 family)